MAPTGFALVTDAMAEALASRIKGAGADKIVMAAAMSPEFARVANTVFKQLERVDARWELKVDQLATRAIPQTTGDDEYDRAEKRYDLQVKVLEDFISSAYKAASKLMENATED